MLFEIGDKVTSRQTGLPMTGTVIAIYESINWLVMTKQNDIAVWSKTYHDWQNKPLYTVKFTKPQRSISFDEFIAANPDINENLKQEAYNAIALIPFANYPEDDLELIEKKVRVAS